MARASSSGHSLSHLRHQTRGPGWQVLGALTTVLVLAPHVTLADGPDRAFLETEELRIVYYDPYEAYLVPHVTQSFLSGLATHERLFDYRPDGRINVFTLDGRFQGQMRTHSHTLVIDGLWALSFAPATATTLNPNWLYFTAGPKDETDGEFGYIMK